MPKVLIRVLLGPFRATLHTHARCSSVPGDLLQRAGACAGRDPERAAELRGAALAYLGVVR